MPRKVNKHKKKGKGGGGGNEDFKQREVLQAILLADSFTTTFRPVTRECPKVLLPLVNVPMIEYTLEFLAANNVEEVFVFCCAKAEQVQEYLAASKWNVAPLDDSDADDDLDPADDGVADASVSGPTVRILTAHSVTSAGDALREIDNLGVIRSNSPFVLVSGDVISNMDLKSAIEQHKARRKKDATTLMTMVFKKAAVNHRTRALDDDLVVAFNAVTNQVLRYDDNVDAEDVTITRDFVAEHPRVQFRYDMLDCHIYVCSPEVLVHFNDNYDYADIRQDYVHNEVQNAALAWRFFAHFIENEYAARVHDPRTYDAVSRDIVARWTYPMVPDTNMVATTSYTRVRDGTYKEHGVRLARSVKLSGDCVLGARTRIGAGSVVNKCVIGRNCVIGKGVTLEGCYLWDNVRVEDGATVSRSIVCSNAVIGPGATVGRGSTISYGVVIGSGFTVPDFSRLTCVPVVINNDFDDSGSDAMSVGSDLPLSGAGGSGAGGGEPPELVWRASEVGTGGKGRMYPAEGESESESDEDDGFGGRGTSGSTGVKPSSRFSSAVHTVMVAMRGGRADRAVPVVRKLLRTVSTVMGADEVAEGRAMLWTQSEGAADNDEAKGEEADFASTVRDMLLGGAEEGHANDAIALEISCFRHAENRTFSDVVSVIMPVILQLIPIQQEKASVKAIQSTLTKWAPLLRKFVQGPLDEATVVESVVHYCNGATPTPLTPLFGVLLLTLFNLDATTAEAILGWANSVKTDPGSPHKSLLELEWTRQLLAHLEEDSSDEESGSDSGSDGSDGSGSDDS